MTSTWYPTCRSSVHDVRRCAALPRQQKVRFQQGELLLVDRERVSDQGQILYGRADSLKKR